MTLPCYLKLMNELFKNSFILITYKHSYNKINTVILLNKMLI